MAVAAVVVALHQVAGLARALMFIVQGQDRPLGHRPLAPGILGAVGTDTIVTRATQFQDQGRDRRQESAMAAGATTIVGTELEAVAEAAVLTATRIVADRPVAVVPTGISKSLPETNTIASEEMHTLGGKLRSEWIDWKLIL